jgi:hypothetical protein
VEQKHRLAFAGDEVVDFCSVDIGEAALNGLLRSSGSGGCHQVCGHAANRDRRKKTSSHFSSVEQQDSRFGRQYGLRRAGFTAGAQISQSPVETKPLLCLRRQNVLT